MTTQLVAFKVSNCVQNIELLLGYSGHGLNNELLLPGIRIAIKKKYVIQKFYYSDVLYSDHHCTVVYVLTNFHKKKSYFRASNTLQKRRLAKKNKTINGKSQKHFSFSVDNFTLMEQQQKCGIKFKTLTDQIAVIIRGIIPYLIFTLSIFCDLSLQAKNYTTSVFQIMCLLKMVL